MSVKPGYITGASAKVKIFNKTLAYATDVSYQVTVQTIPIESMGKFEVHSNEPVSYSVDGSFSIIRYTKAAKALVNGDAAANGNNAHKISDGSGSSIGEHLNPGLLLTSNTFDLDLFQQHAANTTATSNDQAETSFLRITDCRIVRRGGSINKRGVLVENFAFVGVLLHDHATEVTEQVKNSGVTDIS